MEVRRRSFTDEYNRQAFDLVASSGTSIGSVAKELGLLDSMLRRWVERRGAGREPTAAPRRPTTQARCRRRIRPLRLRVYSRKSSGCGSNATFQKLVRWLSSCDTPRIALDNELIVAPTYLNDDKRDATK